MPNTSTSEQRKQQTPRKCVQWSNRLEIIQDAETEYNTATQVLQFTEPPYHLNATPSDAAAQPRAATPPAEAEDTEEDNQKSPQ